LLDFDPTVTLIGTYINNLNKTTCVLTRMVRGFDSYTINTCVFQRRVYKVFILMLMHGPI